MTIYSAVFIQYQRVTDRQTDRRTDRIAISISRLTRDKNEAERLLKMFSDRMRSFDTLNRNVPSTSMRDL